MSRDRRVVVVSHNDAAEGAPVMAQKIAQGLAERCGFAVALCCLSRSQNGLAGFDGIERLDSVDAETVVILNTVVSCKIAKLLAKTTKRILGVVHEVYNETFAWVGPDTFEGVARIVFVSQFCRDSYPTDFFSGAPTRVIHNWLSDRERSLIDLAPRHNGGYALCLGSVARHKGQMVAAKALSGSGMPLVIAGRVYDPEYLEDIKRCFDGEIRVTGHVGRLEAAELLRGASVLVNPSPMESFSLVVQEAMYGLVPVVASRVGGIPEQVADGQEGFLFESGSAADCLEKIGLAIARSANVTRAGRRRSLSCFGEEEKTSQYAEEVDAL
jgi:glycosyltransferase involved in cell wall biosynthesis